MRCHPSNGLTFLPCLFSTGLLVSVGSGPAGELESNLAFLVVALVACPVAGGVWGVEKFSLTGVTRGSVSTAGSIISLSMGRGGGSSMSVTASSSVLARARSWRWAAEGKRRRGLMEERVKGRRRIEDSVVGSLTLLRFGKRLAEDSGSESSSANLRNIFLPRLTIDVNQQDD